MRYPIHRFVAITSLSQTEAHILETLGGAPVERRRGETFQTEGEPATGLHLLLEGWVSSSMLLGSGRRLIQKIHLPGDMLATPSMALGETADTLTAVTTAKTSFVPYKRIGDLFVSVPRIAALFTIAVQMERLALMDALAITGNASAREQLARLLLDLHARLDAIGAVEDDCFDLPLTQEIIGDLLGLTAVHVNRTFRSLEEGGLIRRKAHRLHLLDLPGLRRLSPLSPRRPRFEPDWLPPSTD